MGYKMTKAMKSEIEKSNYIFYISEKDAVPSLGHFRKMDAGIEIAEHICAGNPAQIVCYTDYDGREIEADSVGIIFPAHTWGTSFAVYSFLQHLNIKRGTYVYAVAVGESYTNNMTSLDQFVRMFERKRYGTTSDVFVRSTDRKRTVKYTEDCLTEFKPVNKRVEDIMEGLLFHSIETLDKEFILEEKENDFTFDKAEEIKTRSTMRENFRTYRPKAIHLNNVYLDEDILSGVRLCQVM